MGAATLRVGPCHLCSTTKQGVLPSGVGRDVPRMRPAVLTCRYGRSSSLCARACREGIAGKGLAQRRLYLYIAARHLLLQEKRRSTATPFSIHTAWTSLLQGKRGNTVRPLSIHAYCIVLTAPREEEDYSNTLLYTYCIISAARGLRLLGKI